MVSETAVSKALKNHFTNKGMSNLLKALLSQRTRSKLIASTSVHATNSQICLTKLPWTPSLNGLYALLVIWVYELFNYGIYVEIQVFKMVLPTLSAQLRSPILPPSLLLPWILFSSPSSMGPPFYINQQVTEIEGIFFIKNLPWCFTGLKWLHKSNRTDVY